MRLALAEKTNRIEIVYTDQNTLSDLQNRRAAEILSRTGLIPKHFRNRAEQIDTCRTLFPGLLTPIRQNSQMVSYSEVVILPRVLKVRMWQVN